MRGRDTVATISPELRKIGDRAEAFLRGEFRKTPKCPLQRSEQILDSLLGFYQHEGCRDLFRVVNRHVRRHAPLIAANYTQAMHDVRGGGYLGPRYGGHSSFR